jgi:hypothetical protein
VIVVDTVITIVIMLMALVTGAVLVTGAWRE